MMITLTACDGALRGVNAAIFVDAGWEPPAVYEQVDRIDPELNRVGIQLYRVSSGNLRLCSFWRWDAGTPRRMRVAVRVWPVGVGCGPRTAGRVLVGRVAAVMWL
jgi:hypothetical protein